MGFRDLGDVGGPFFPVVRIAAFFDDLGVEGAFQLADLELEFRLDGGGVARLGGADGVLVFPGLLAVAFGGGGFFLGTEP